MSKHGYIALAAAFMVAVVSGIELYDGNYSTPWLVALIVASWIGVVIIALGLFSKTSYPTEFQPRVMSDEDRAITDQAMQDLIATTTKQP
jgi:hypothetical protein